MKRVPIRHIKSNSQHPDNTIKITGIAANGKQIKSHIKKWRNESIKWFIRKEHRDNRFAIITKN